MKRVIIKIDELKCNGCGACVEGCHEGALQIIDNKARIISDLFCDGLGVCIGECPVGAIELEEREAEPYDERAVMDRIAPKGEQTIVAHLVHLRDHNEIVFFNEGLAYLEAKGIKVTIPAVQEKTSCAGGCSGGSAQPFSSASIIVPNILTFNVIQSSVNSATPSITPNNSISKGAPSNVTTNSNSAQSSMSQLRQWPVQLQLINPEANYFKGSDVVIAADCTAYSYADFHNHFLKDKTIAIACPRLDSDKDGYVEKLKTMINNSLINTLTVVIMEVPCCGGLLTLARTAISQAKRKIPLKSVIINIHGVIIRDEWL